MKYMAAIDDDDTPVLTPVGQLFPLDSEGKFRDPDGIPWVVDHEIELVIDLENPNDG